MAGDSRISQNKNAAPRRQDKAASAALISKIKQSLSMVDVVGEHVLLKKSGANWTGLCPFHNERSPSFSVHEGKQLYHCYGCKEGGDLVSFVMAINGLSFGEAVEELASRAGISLPQEFMRGQAASQQNPEARKSFKLNRFAASFYRQQLLNDNAFAHACQAYLKKRGMQEESLRNFYVGTIPSDWDLLTRFLLQSKAPMDLAAKLGLIIPSKQKVAGRPEFFDFLRNRIVFPILDTRGRVIAFSGRLIDGEGPKYLNSPDSFLYSKSRAAFGLFQAKKHIRECDEVIIVEGQFDVLSMHQMGFCQTVATCGTALTAEHIQLFQRLGKKITVLFDGDAAGQAAAQRAMELGLQKGIVVWGATLPQGRDPNELLVEGESGIETVKQLLQQAQPLLDTYLFQTMEAVGDKLEARADALKKIGHWLSQFSDPVGREVRVQALIERYQIDRHLLLKAMPGSVPSSGPEVRSRTKAQPGVPRKPSPRPKSWGPARLSSVEKSLLRELLKEKSGQKMSVVDKISPNLPPAKSLADCFEHPEVRQFFDQMNFSTGKFDPSLLGTAPAEVRSTITEFISQGKSPASMSPENDLEKEDASNLLVARILSLVWARFSHEIRGALARAEAAKDTRTVETLSQDYLDVQRKMKEFNSFYGKA